MKTKKRCSWKEAPLFHLVGMLFAAPGLFWAVFCYIRDIPSDGWWNDWAPGSVIYAMILVYFICGCQSGLGEAEAVDEALKERKKDDE